LNGTPSNTFSVNQKATSGTTTAQATAVDASGNIYVIGAATGNFANQLNQGSQDVYLTKYDSAGNVVFQNLLGSGGSASGYGLALDPSGGVVVTGASTADLTTTSVANGNNDSFVARYDANGNQTWIKQIQTLATNQSNTVSVDASGNIIIGGSVSGGVVGAGQVSQGKGDAFLAKYDSKGKLLAETQFGTSGKDSVAATATAADGRVVRKVFRPPSWWSFDENPRQLGEYLQSARYWARNEINRLRGLPTFEEIEERKRRQIAARRGKHTLFENLP